MIQKQSPQGTFVCGALGRVDPEDWRRLLEQTSHPKVLFNLPHAKICGTQVSEVRGALHWGALVRPATGAVPEPEDAGEARVSAGAYITGKEVVVHTDVFGMQPLYYRDSGVGLLLATKLDPLVRSARSPLHLDWEAWSTLLTFGAPFGSHTPFSEVRRFRAGERVVATERGDVRFESRAARWLTSVGPPATPGEVAEALLGAMPPVWPWQKPPAVTLSGGWDSRLLAGLATRRYSRKPRAWTTRVDDGREFDLDFAPAVAQGLGLEHRIFLPEPGSFSKSQKRTWNRVEHQTPLHAWLEPLAKEMRREERRVLDGLAGGVLLQGNFVFRHILAAGDRKAQLESLSARLGSEGPGGLAMDSTHFSKLTDSAKVQFRAEADVFRDHPNQLMLTLMMTRIARVVSPSPLSLFGPELEVTVPYLAPEPMERAVSVRPEDKLDGALFRPLLDLAAGRVAKLPSTNDPLPPKRFGKREQRSPRVTRFLAAQIVDDTVLRSLCPKPTLERFELARDGHPPKWTPGEAKALLQFAMFGHFRRKYEDVLGNLNELP